MTDRVPLVLDDVPEMLSYIRADDRDTWVAVGMGLKAEFGNPAFDEWDKWSQTGDGYDKAAARTVWKSMKKGGTGMGTVIKLAMDGGWRPQAEPMTAEEKRRRAAEGEARRAARQAEIEADEARAAVMRNAVAQACRLIWDKHCKPRGDSAYLARKGVAAHGVRFVHYTVVLSIDDERQRADVWVGSESRAFFESLPKPRPDSVSFLMFKRGAVVMPLVDAEGVLWSLQMINEQGTKLFPKYSRKSGCFHVIGELDGDGVLAFAEGYATGASVHEALLSPVVVTVDSGNLLTVARELRGRWPDRQFLICGDDDPDKPGNPGRTKAEKTAAEVGALVAFPSLPVEGA